MPGYGSAGASCNLELEVDTSLLDADLAGFHDRVKAAYVAAQQAVQDQLQRLQGTSPGRPTPDADGQSTDPKRSRAWGGPIRADRVTSRQRRPATQKQLAKIRAIVGRRDDTDLRDLLRTLGADRLSDLDLAGASSLIDTLVAAEP